MKVLTAAEMREVDRRTIEEIGVPVWALMENAGRAVADAVIPLSAARCPDPRSVAVVCGRGHNGGDGLVAARHLANRGVRVRVFLLGRTDALRSEPVRGNAVAVRRIGIPLDEVLDDDGPALDLARFDVVIDAIFGTGFRPPATGLEARAIDAINRARTAGARIVAIDLPSGLDADRGSCDGPTVAADVTVTFAALKPAHMTLPAEARCGRVVVADIAIPLQLVDSDAHQLELITAAMVAARLPARPADAHKGTFGHLLLVAGAVGKTGAAVLAARAALRAGAGLVTVATPSLALPLVAAGAPEIMTEPLDDDVAAAHARVAELLTTRDALALGPGLTTGAAAQRLTLALLDGPTRPLVVDADALNALAASGRILDLRGAPVILTPHPGEAGRLLGCDAAAVNADRVVAARELASRHGAIVILKGRRTIVAEPSGRAFINDTGNPGLATAGAGDVLTGIVGALLAQGVGARDAAIAAVYLHGLAGDLAAVRIGGRADAHADADADLLARRSPTARATTTPLIASDIIAALPAAFTAVAELA